MHRRRTSPLVLVLLASGAYGQSAGLDQLIRQALDQHRDILAARERLVEARGLLRQAGVRPAPAIQSTAASGRPLRTAGEEEYTLGYVQPLETGGKRSKRIEVAERAIAVAEAELEERRRQLAYEVRTRWADAAAARRKIDAIERIVEVNRESYRLVDARVRQDDAAPLERQLLLVDLNRTEAQRAVASGQSQSAELDLRRAAGLSADVELRAVPAVAPVADALDRLLRRALDKRPDLRSARALAGQAEAELELARAQGSPDLTLSAQYARRYAQMEDPTRTLNGSPVVLKDRDNVLTVGVSLPLRTGARNKGNVEAAAARWNAAKLRVEQLAVAIPLEVESAWRRYQSALNANSILGSGVVEESRRNLSVIRQAYNLGQLRLLDVLNEQRRLLETELTVIDAETELARTRAELERAVGGGLR